jgi:hypothetical protein
MRHRVLIGALILTAIAVCIGAGQWFYQKWFQPLPTVRLCEDRLGAYRVDVKEDWSDYYRCVDERAKLFIDRDYAETKDLAKAFLTLLTAVLVASITFSEKIVDVNRSGWWPRGLMIGSWILLLAAIASCGAGLGLMAEAAGYAAYFPHADFRLLEMTAVRLFISAGLAFGGGLASLLVAGVVSLLDHKSAPQ